MEFWKCSLGLFQKQTRRLKWLLMTLLHAKCHWQLNNSFVEGVWEHNDPDLSAFIVLKILAGLFCQVLVLNICVCVCVFVCLSVFVCFAAFLFEIRPSKWNIFVNEQHYIYIWKYLGSMWIIKLMWYLSEKLPLVDFLFSPFWFYLCFSFMLSATSWKKIIIRVYIYIYILFWRDSFPFSKAICVHWLWTHLSQMWSEFCLIQRGFQLYVICTRCTALSCCSDELLITVRSTAQR